MKIETVNKNIFPLTMQFQTRFPTFQVTRVLYDKGCTDYNNPRYPSLFIGFIPQTYENATSNFTEAVKALDYLYFSGTKKLIKRCFLSYTKEYIEKLIENSKGDLSKIIVKCKLQHNIFSESIGLSENDILYDDSYPDLDEKCFMLMQLEKKTVS